MPDFDPTTLTRLLANHSRFLAAEADRRPDLLADLIASGQLEAPLPPEQYAAALAQLPFEPVSAAAYRRESLLRILLRDLLGLANLAETTADISHLADAIVHWACLGLIPGLKARYGTPIGVGGQPASFSVLALGKLGGRELNYSSDIDLLFLFSEAGETDGPRRITNKEYFEELARQLTQFLGAYTASGICYRVDLRLRPDGSLGELAHSLEAAQEYYRGRARDWELQMLIKARPAAGDPAPALALQEFVEPYIYRTTTDFSAIEAVSATRLRINEKLSARRLKGDTIDVKLCRGGIRDIEFLVQCLQRLHGGREPWVRHGGTLLALSRLHDKSLISTDQFHSLSLAYEFLRHLEHRLQIYEDLQVHHLPESLPELEALAQAMPPIDLGHPNTASRLLDRLKFHCDRVERIYSQTIYPPPAPAHRSEFLAAPSGSTISPWLTAELRRKPELAAEADVPLHTAFDFPSPLNPDRLRHAWRRHLFRIQSHGIAAPQSIFETLARNSDLADEVIRHAYRIALEATPGLEAAFPVMSVIALGRLGQREFDLSSDADILFVLPDEHAEHLEFWTRVAARIIEILTVYTADGFIFPVDTRLRPYGREGDLVQTERAYFDYFSQRAEAWEGIAYMKARAIAGDLDRGTHFLHELQQVDWRRYGQSHRSRDQLRQIRARIEKEQGKSDPLKAGRGGYYDIDFILMYLRLRSAGIFFKVLSTLERINVVEQMGLLDRDDASFLRLAATFYRRLDHSLRVTGKPWTLLDLAPATYENELLRIQAETRAAYERIFC